jgi:DNA-3-methyladenine glycosylase II
MEQKCAPPKTLNRKTFIQGISHLTDIDPDLARIVSKFGFPPIWAREPGFPTLVLIILEQQVSLASARAAFTRLLEAASPLTPRHLLGLTDRKLKAIGFSRQKASYCRELAKAILNGEIDLSGLKRMEPTTAREKLMERRGIGGWTADIYLMMALLKPDIWPCGDLALAAAVQEVKKLPSRPSPEQLNQISRPWRPWRAVAARILWHHYLSKK